MKRLALGLFVLFAVVYLTALVGRPLSVPDEMRYGQIAREMIDSGDWVVPHLMGLRYFEKPVLGYWLNAGAMELFGANRFGIRFASAATAGLSALVLFLLVRRVRDEKTALLAAFIQLTFAEVVLLGTYSSLDTMVSSFITLSLCAFFLAQQDAGGKRAGWLLAVGLSAGCAFMVKGFLALAIPAMVIAGFLCMGKRWKDLFTMPWLPLLGILLVALPWSIAVALKEPDFWNYFFFEEHIHRFFGKGEAEHSEPFWYFVPVLLVGALPWTLVAPGALAKVWQERRKDALMRYCAVWLVLPFLFFSVSSGKLGTYILPCFPPLAIMLAEGFRASAEKGGRYIRVGSIILFVVLVLGFIGLGITALLPVEAVKLYKPWEAYKYIYFLAGLAVAALISSVGLKARTGSMRLACMGVAVALGLFAFQFCIPESRSVTVSIERFLRTQLPHMPEDALVVTDSRGFSGAGMILGHTESYILGGMGELDYGLAYPDAAHRYVGSVQNDLVDFVARHRDRPVVYLGLDWYIEPFLDQLPEYTHRDEFRYLRFYVFPAANLEDAQHAK